MMMGSWPPILGGYRSELTSPMAFLQRPARWVQSLATNTHVFSAAPNFAFELAVRKTSDDDMAGLDLSGVLSIVSGAERVHPATLERFSDRFAAFGFRDHMMRPSYGLAEATVYVASRSSGEPPEIVDFDAADLSEGTARRCTSGPAGWRVRPRRRRWCRTRPAAAGRPGPARPAARPAVPAGRRAGRSSA